MHIALAGQLFAAPPRIAFERVLPAPHDLGGAQEIALTKAIGDNATIELFVEDFIHHATRYGHLRMRDARRETALRAGANLAVKTFTCETTRREAEGSSYDVDGKRVKRMQSWVDAVCVARIDVAAGTRKSSFYVKGEGTSPRGDVVSEEETNAALELAARHAAVDAAERITPRRVRESILLEESAPAFEEGMARVDAQRIADARSIWEKALQKQPRSAALHFNLAAACEALGDRKAAELHYVAARTLAPGESRYASEWKEFLRRGVR